MKKLLLSLLVVAAVFAGSVGLGLAADPTDAAKQQVCEGISGQVGGSCAGAAGGTSLQDVLRGVLQVLSFIAGIAAVIMIVVAGLKYITSGGDSSNIASAKSSLIYAIVGLIVVAMAQLIVRFVLSTAK